MNGNVKIVDIRSVGEWTDFTRVILMHPVGTGHGTLLAWLKRRIEGPAQDAVYTCGECRSEYATADEVRRCLSDHDAHREAERQTSCAYLRLRGIIPGALATPFGPTPEEVWLHVEECARKVVAERDALTAKLKADCDDRDRDKIELKLLRGAVRELLDELTAAKEASR